MSLTWGSAGEWRAPDRGCWGRGGGPGSPACTSSGTSSHPAGRSLFWESIYTSVSTQYSRPTIPSILKYMNKQTIIDVRSVLCNQFHISHHIVLFLHRTGEKEIKGWEALSDCSLPSISQTVRAWRWPLSNCVVRDRQRRENHRDGQKTVVMILCTVHCTLYTLLYRLYTSRCIEDKRWKFEKMNF